MLTRQVAIGAILGFTLAVLALSLWPRPASPPPGPDAGAPQELPRLEIRSLITAPPDLRHHREVFEVVSRDGGR